MNKELNCANCCICDFKEDLCDCDGDFCKEFKGIGSAEDFKNAVMERIRPKGQWEEIVELDSGGYPFQVGVCCSACGFQTLSEDNYCPYCGAKMEASE